MEQHRTRDASEAKKKRDTPAKLGSEDMMMRVADFIVSINLCLRTYCSYNLRLEPTRIAPLVLCDDPFRRTVFYT